MPRVTISEPGKTPQPYRFQLERTTVNIGRGSENDIIIESPSCSTNHCVMQRVSGGYILRDTNSTNGIKEHDTLMEIIDLFDGMELLIGDVPFSFTLSEEELTELSQEKFKSHQQRKLPPISEEEEVSEYAEKEETHPTAETPRSSQTQQSSNEGLKTLIILIIMVIAVALGLTLRHYKETGDFLPTKLMEAQ